MFISSLLIGPATRPNVKEGSVFNETTLALWDAQHDEIKYLA